MLTSAEFIRESLETNLFFLRIMKEHIIFAASALTLKDAAMVPKLMQTKDMFERLLNQTVDLAGGYVTPTSLSAGDIITEYTYKAEIATSNFTGLPIDTNITLKEIRLLNNQGITQQVATESIIEALNRRIIGLLVTTIKTQKDILQNVISCKMYTHIYPQMLDHVTREAEHYLEHLRMLQRRESMNHDPKQEAAHEAFWNDIMGEHAKFIRGMLDPTEDELIRIANGFSEEFDELTAAAREAFENLSKLPQVKSRSTVATTNIRNFKEQGTEGILACNIRSIILPLLSDHVLREANHYLKHLKM